MHYQRINFGYEGQRTSCRNWPMRDWIKVIWRKLIREKITQEKAPRAGRISNHWETKVKLALRSRRHRQGKWAVELEWWTGLKQGVSGSDDREESVYSKDSGRPLKGKLHDLLWEEFLWLSFVWRMNWRKVRGQVEETILREMGPSERE